MVLPSQSHHGNKLNNITKRRFLLSSAALFGTAAIAGTTPGLALADTTPATSDLTKMASFLTGKSVDAALAQRAGSAIGKIDQTYPQALAKLQAFIAANNIADVESLQDAPGFDDELRGTARTLISALYLGYAGTPKGQSATDDVQFVTYTQALTYQLTYPFTPIPSYSRWSSGYWAHLPEAG